MMIGQLGWEKIDLIRVLKHFEAMLYIVHNSESCRNHAFSISLIYSFRVFLQ